MSIYSCFECLNVAVIESRPQFICQTQLDFIHSFGLPRVLLVDNQETHFHGSACFGEYRENSSSAAIRCATKSRFSSAVPEKVQFAIAKSTENQRKERNCMSFSHRTRVLLL